MGAGPGRGRLHAHVRSSMWHGPHPATPTSFWEAWPCMDQSEKDSWEKAKLLLIGAVDTVLQKNDKSSGKQARPDRFPDGSRPSVSGTKPKECKKLSPYEEHRRLFGYQAYSTGPKRSYKPKGKKKAATWTKDVICLKYSDQDASPTTEEKMELAALNLGSRNYFLVQKVMHPKSMKLF